jgi:hypothetical protein
MQNYAIKSTLFINLALGALLVGLLLMNIAFPQLTAHADGGGFPTATSIPTLTPTLTQAPAKSLGETLPLPAPTFTSQPLSAPAAAAPAVENGSALTATSAAASLSGAPVPASGEADPTAAKTSSLTIPVIIGLAGLATLGIAVLLILFRRKK